MSSNLKLYEQDFLNDFYVEFCNGRDLKEIKKELSNLTVGFLTKAYFTSGKKQTKSQLAADLAISLQIPPTIAFLLIKENESKVKNESTKEKVKDLVIVNLENQLKEIEDVIDSLNTEDSSYVDKYVELSRLKNSTLSELAKAVNLNEKTNQTTIVQGSVNNTNNTQNNLNLSKLDEKNIVDGLLGSLLGTKQITS
jgi:hypothetical protein